MEITIKDCDTVVIIKHEKDYMSVLDVWENLIAPALLGLGYTPSSVYGLVEEEKDGSEIVGENPNKKYSGCDCRCMA